MKIKLLEHPLVRNISSKHLIEIFLVCSVSTLVLVRFFLELTNYPRIGGGGLHIAHMLWGGLLLVASLVLCLIFLNRSIRYMAAFIGGIGFGLFIDELGKFVTSDNNYLFQPALAAIYVIFIILFLILRKIGSRAYTDEEYFVNSIEYTKEGVTGELTQAEKDTALGYLKHIKTDVEGVRLLRQVLTNLQPSPPTRMDGVAAFLHRSKEFYRSISNRKWFKRCIVGIFILSALGTFIGVFTVIGISLYKPHLLDSADLSTSVVIQTISSVVGSFFILIGMVRIRKSPLRAYRYFKTYLLIDILITTVFEFYTNQLGAITGLIFDLFLFASINFMIEAEEEDQSTGAVK